MFNRKIDSAQADAPVPIDNVELLAAVALELTTHPIDGPLLHQHIWNYVVAERNLGTPPGRVIMLLTELVEESVAAEEPNRQALQRVVLHSAVEAYFGQHDGSLLGSADFSAFAHAEAMKLPTERSARGAA
jgi:hypothetical protein